MMWELCKCASCMKRKHEVSDGGTIQDFTDWLPFRRSCGSYTDTYIDPCLYLPTCLHLIAHAQTFLLISFVSVAYNLCTVNQTLESFGD